MFLRDGVRLDVFFFDAVTLTIFYIYYTIREKEQVVNDIPKLFPLSPISYNTTNPTTLYSKDSNTYCNKFSDGFHNWLECRKLLYKQVNNVIMQVVTKMVNSTLRYYGVSIQ